MTYQWLHELTFYLLYGVAALSSFIIVERFIYYIYHAGQAKQITDRLHNQESLRTIARDLSKPSIAAEVVQRALHKKDKVASTRDHLDDMTEAIYIAAKTKLNRHLWILDTVVTAAPLLGLLGTILGIFEAFGALASAGVSDPSQVSSAIGAALLATALGISIALYGLVFYNLFLERVDRIGDHVKVILLHADVDTPHPVPLAA